MMFLGRVARSQFPVKFNYISKTAHNHLKPALKMWVWKPETNFMSSVFVYELVHCGAHHYKILILHTA